MASDHVGSGGGGPYITCVKYKNTTGSVRTTLMGSPGTTYSHHRHFHQRPHNLSNARARRPCTALNKKPGQARARSVEVSIHRTDSSWGENEQGHAPSRLAARRTGCSSDVPCIQTLQRHHHNRISRIGVQFSLNRTCYRM